MAYNSTIKVKKKICISCGRLDFWFSKKRCKSCATVQDSLARMEEESDNTIQEEGLQELIKLADEWFSKWLRLSQADKDGYVTCFLFGTRIRWQDSDCSHFVKRGANLYLRFDTRNVTVQSKLANETNDGHMGIYRQKLNEMHPGLPDILDEESHLIAKPTRSEMRSIYNEYKLKANQLLKRFK